MSKYYLIKEEELLQLLTQVGTIGGFHFMKDINKPSIIKEDSLVNKVKVGRDTSRAYSQMELEIKEMLDGFLSDKKSVRLKRKWFCFWKTEKC